MTPRPSHIERKIQILYFLSPCFLVAFLDKIEIARFRAPHLIAYYRLARKNSDSCLASVSIRSSLTGLPFEL